MLVLTQLLRFVSPFFWVCHLGLLLAPALTSIANALTTDSWVAWLIPILLWVQLVEYPHFPPNFFQDQLVMLTHHFVTLALCILSYYAGAIGPGIQIMLIFDIADISLALNKILLYVGMKHVGVSIFFFTMFILSWILTRHIYVGAFLYHIIVYRLDLTSLPTSIDFIIVLFIILELACLFWLLLIVQMVYRASKPERLRILGLMTTIRLTSLEAC